MENKQDSQCAYKPNNESRSRNNCSRVKAISITYSECVFLVLVTKHAVRMRRCIVISGLSGSNIYSHIIS
jgi:hypothetical protein